MAVDYRSVAVRPETKDRLEALRASGRYASTDAIIAAALDRLEVAETAAEVRSLARRARPTHDILAELEAASEGLEETLRATRGGLRKRHGRHPRA